LVRLSGLEEKWTEERYIHLTEQVNLGRMQIPCHFPGINFAVGQGSIDVTSRTCLVMLKEPGPKVMVPPFPHWEIAARTCEESNRHESLLLLATHLVRVVLAPTEWGDLTLTKDGTIAGGKEVCKE
jgi:hypothetical protein